MNESSLSGKKIRQAVEEWQVTFDAIPDLVSIIDRDFRLRAMNSAFTKGFKVKPEDPRDGIKVFRLFGPHLECGFLQDYFERKSMPKNCS